MKQKTVVQLHHLNVNAKTKHFLPWPSITQLSKFICSLRNWSTMAQKVQLRELPNSQLYCDVRKTLTTYYFKTAYKHALISHLQ